MLNLGSIVFGLDADSSGLNKAQRDLQNFGRNIDAVMKRGADSTQNLIRTEGQLVRSLQQVQNMSARISSMKISPQVSTEAIRQLETAYSAMVDRLKTKTNQPLNGLQMQRGVQGFNEQVQAIQRTVAANARLQREEEQTQKAANSAAKAVEANYEKQRLAVMRAEAAVVSLNDQISRSQHSGLISSSQAAGLRGRTSGALGAYSGGLNGSQTLDAAGFAKAQHELNAALTGVRRDISETQKAVNPLVGAMSAFGTAAELTAGPMNGFVFRIRAANSLMREHGVAIGLAAASLVGFAGAAVGAAEAMGRAIIQEQQVTLAMDHITNNNALGSASFEILRSTANKAGLSIADLAPAYVRFQGAAEAAGQSASVTNKEFSQISMIAGTLGRTSSETSNLIRVFDEMTSRGYVMSRDIVQQLARDLPGGARVAEAAFAEMSGKTKMSMTEFEDALKKGQIAGPQFVNAFLDAYSKMFHIDLATPVQTLQASLNRVGNSWNEFTLNMAQALNASQGFQNALAMVGNTLSDLANHASTVIPIIGAVGGALLGLGTALVITGAVGAGITIFTTLSEGLGAAMIAMRGFQVAEEAAMLTTKELAVATAGLDIAMDANPIGAAAMLLLQLAAALGGATLAYNAMNGVVNKNQAALADTSGIEAYIASSMRAQKQTAAFTAELEKQIQVMQAANSAQVADDMKQLGGAQRNLGDMQSMPGGKGLAYAAGAIQFHTFDPGKITAGYASSVRSAGANLKDAMTENAKLASLVDGLHKVSKLPDDTTMPKPDLKALKNKTKDPNRGLSSLDDLIQKAADAKKALDNMFRGPQDEGLLAALEEAKQKLFDMQPDQKGQLTKMLGSQAGRAALGGMSVESLGGLQAAIAVVIDKTKIATQTVSDFNKIWDDAHKGVIELQGIRDQFNYLAKGGDPNSFAPLEAIKQANAELEKLNKGSLADFKAALSGSGLNQNAQNQLFDFASSSKSAALQATVKLMDSLGMGVSHTGDAAKDAKADWVAYFNSLDQGQKDVETLRRSMAALKELRIEMTQTQQAFNLIGTPQGTSFGLQHLANQQKAQDQLRNLTPAGQSAIAAQLGGAGSAVDQLTAALDKLDLQQNAIKDWQKILSDQEGAWTSFADNSVDALQKVLQGTENMGQAVKSVIKDLADTILKAAIFDPIKDNLNAGIRNFLSGAPSTPGIAGTNGFSSIFSNLFQGSIFSPGGGIGGVANKLLGGGSAPQAANTAAIGLNTTALGTLTAVLTGTSTTGGLSGASGIMAALGIAGVGASSGIGTTAASLAASGIYIKDGGFLGLKTFANGGLNGIIRGPGGPRQDSILARVSAGEFVVKASATQRNRQLLEAINGDKVSAFSNGGPVGGVNGDLWVPTSTSGSRSSMGPDSQLNSSPKSAIFSPSTTIHVHGNMDSVTMRQLQNELDARDRNWRTQLPTAIDGRVQDSLMRNRYQTPGS